VSTLYAPMDDEVYEDLRSIARLAGLSIAKTATTIIASAAGRQTTYTQQVDRARKVWKDSQK
jgi:hypothetical protein